MDGEWNSLVEMRVNAALYEILRKVVVITVISGDFCVARYSACKPGFESDVRKDRKSKNRIYGSIQS